MELTAGLFADTETAYRHERISRSFRDHSAVAPPAPAAPEPASRRRPRLAPDAEGGVSAARAALGIFVGPVRRGYPALSLAPAMMVDVPPLTDIRGPLVGRADELDRLAGLVGVGAPERTSRRRPAVR